MRHISFLRSNARVRSRLLTVRADFLPLALLLVFACGDPKPSRPALLGMKSDAVITRIKSGCNGKLSADAIERKDFRSEWLECTLPNTERYRVVFERDGRISEISISAPENDALEIFDRVVALIVPASVREDMRRSVTDPTLMMNAAKSGPCIDVIALGAGWQTAGASRDISWHLDQCVASK